VFEPGNGCTIRRVVIVLVTVVTTHAEILGILRRLANTTDNIFLNIYW
jgi:hypothetical protein